MEEYLKKKAIQLNIRIDDDEISKFLQYKNLLISYNEEVNLTAITEDKQIALKHFIDSLTVCEYLTDGCSIIDVGTGAGFPGIPLKIVRNDIELTLLDSLKKRIYFLDEVISRLGLKGITCVHARAEEAGASALYREGFDFAVSRAVAPLSVLCEYCLPFVKKGGFFLAMKGSFIDAEADEAANAINVLGGQIKECRSFNLDEEAHSRSIIVIEKVSSTPNGFPRRAGKPSRSPL